MLEVGHRHGGALRRQAQGGLLPQATHTGPDDDRHLLNEAVHLVEQAVRETMAPLKVNLASLGNVVPHLHWHIIPRYADDAHFPAPVWAQSARQTDASTLAARRALLPDLAAAIAKRFNE